MGVSGALHSRPDGYPELQLGTLVVIPALVLFMSSMFGVLILGVVEMLIFSVLILLADLIIAYLALKVFRREEILVSWRSVFPSKRKVAR